MVAMQQELEAHPSNFALGVNWVEVNWATLRVAGDAHNLYFRIGWADFAHTRPPPFARGS
jgi:hypothetical protein